MINKKENLVCFMILLSGVFSGCSKGELNPTPPDLKAETIALRSSISSMHPVSRSPFMGTLSADNQLTARVLASETSLDYTSLYANGSMTFGTPTAAVAYNTTGFSGNESFPDEGEALIYLFGLTPSEGWSVASNTASITLSGKEDLMTANEVSTNKKKVREHDYATLAFEHHLTLLEIAVHTENQDAVTKWEKVTGIKLTKTTTSQVESRAVVDLSAGTVTLDTPQNSQKCYGLSVASGTATYSDTEYAGTTLVGGESKSVAYSLISPVKATALDKEYTFIITTSKGGIEKTSTVAIDLNDKMGNPFVGSTAGYSFIVTFYFQNGNIKAAATVKDWQGGGEYIVPIG